MARRSPSVGNRGNYKHGMKGTRVHNTWISMRQRCTNPKHSAFKHYGGRGITICKRWQKFENFYTDMGDPPDGLTLERKENNKGYNKKNCEWAPQKDQVRNKRDTKLTLEKAVEIVRLRNMKIMTDVALGKRYDIGPDHVRKICKGRLWPEATEQHNGSRITIK